MDQEKLMQLSDAIFYSRNVLNLKIAAISKDGLLSAEIRKSAWAIMLNCGNEDLGNRKISCPDEGIIEKDIERSIFGMDVSDAFTDEEREEKRKELSKIVNSVIGSNRELNYVQGFNHICTVFLLNGGAQIAYHLSEKCALDMLRDILRKRFEQGTIQQLKLIYKVLQFEDPLVACKLESLYSFEGNVDIPSIAVPWIICWFSSSFYKLEKISRIFDFIIATHALAPVYLSAVLIMSKKKELLECQDHCDIHTLFRHIEDVDVEEICAKAFEIMTKFPPTLLAEKYRDQFLPE